MMVKDSTMVAVPLLKVTLVAIACTLCFPAPLLLVRAQPGSYRSLSAPVFSTNLLRPAG